MKILKDINILFRQILFFLNKFKYSNIRECAKLNGSTSPNSTRISIFSCLAAYYSTFWLCGTKTLPVLIVQLFQDAPRRIVSLRIKGTSCFSGMVFKAWPKSVISVATASEKCKQLIVWTQQDDYKNCYICMSGS